MADDREITMEGDNAQYEEHAGAAAPHLPLYRTREEGTNLYEFLVRGGYIDGKTDRECWLYQMGCTAEQSAEVNPIRWLHTKEQLRHMLLLFYKGMLDEGNIKIADLTRQVPNLFVDKNGNAIELSKPRKEVSGEPTSKWSENFFIFPWKKFVRVVTLQCNQPVVCRE